MKTLTMPNDSSQSDLQIKLVREMIGFVMNGTLKLATTSERSSCRKD